MSDTEVMAMPVGDSDDDKKEEIKVEISPGVPVGVGRPNRPQRHRLPEIKNYKFSLDEVLLLYEINPSFRAIMDTDRYIFIDGCLCLKSRSCIRKMGGRLRMRGRYPAFMHRYCICKPSLSTREAAILGTHNGAVIISHNGVKIEIPYAYLPDSKYKHAPEYYSLSNENYDIFSDYVSGGKEPPNGSFGETLSYYLNRANLTHEQMAELISVTPETISRYCRDVSVPQPETAIAICVALHLTSDESIDLIEKIGMTLKGNTEQIRAFRFIIHRCYYISIEECNRALIKRNLKPLTMNRERKPKE